MVGAGPLHLEVDRAGDDVARREIAARVVALHEGRPVEPAQDGALAAHRLGDEKALRLRVVEARRVKLVKLHVRDLGARPVRHRDPVAGRDVGVGRVEVDLAGAARREDHRARQDRDDLAARVVEHVRAGAHLGPAVLRERDEVDGGVPLEDADAGRAGHGLEERALDLAPGHVGGVRDAARAVAALEVQVEVGVVGLGHVPSFAPSAMSNRAPTSRSILMRAGASLTQISTASSWQRPAPAWSVSAMCASNESPSPSTAAMPPWAYLVFDSSALRLVTTRTSPLRRRLEREATGRPRRCR